MMERDGWRAEPQRECLGGSQPKNRRGRRELNEARVMNSAKEIDAEARVSRRSGGLDWMYVQDGSVFGG